MLLSREVARELTVYA